MSWTNRCAVGSSAAARRKSHDVLDLITLTTFNQPAEQLRPDQLNWARAMLQECERTIGRRFAPGRNHRLRSMAFFGLEGLEPCWKPLLFYLCTQTCQGVPPRSALPRLRTARGRHAQVLVPPGAPRADSATSPHEHRVGLWSWSGAACCSAATAAAAASR